MEKKVGAKKYRLINYFDVWGNPKDGWEVNCCTEFDDLWITDDSTEKEKLDFLVKLKFLATSDRRRVGIDNDGLIYARKGYKPLGFLEEVV